MSEPHLQKQFEIRVEVASPVLVGQDEHAGRRQLIPILSGTLTGAWHPHRCPRRTLPGAEGDGPAGRCRQPGHPSGRTM